MHRKFQPKYLSLVSLILHISNHHGIVQKAKFHPLVTHITLSKNYLSTLRLNFGKIMAFLLNQNYLVTPKYICTILYKPQLNFFELWKDNREEKEVNQIQCGMLSWSSKIDISNIHMGPNHIHLWWQISLKT